MTEPVSSPLPPEHGVVASDPQVSPEMVDRAVSTVRALAGWHVWPVREEQLVELVPGDGVVIFPTKRLIDLISLDVDGTDYPVDRLVYGEEGVVYVPGLHPRADGIPRKITATVVHGFESPPDLISVILSMAKRAQQAGTNVTVGQISVGAPGGFTPQSTEWRILDLYKLGPRP